MDAAASRREADDAWQPSPQEVVVIFCALVVTWLAARLRTPLLASLRHLAIGVVIAMAIALMIASCRGGDRVRRRRQAWRAIGFGVSLLALCLGGARELAFQQARAAVLRADRGVMARLGAHVIVGYERFDDAVRLLERRAIAGVFVTARNVRGRTVEQVGADIGRLQAVQRAVGGLPLWIAADQEGGAVSRLSPPLPRSPLLAATIDEPAAVRRQRADAVGADLARLGVNINLAPVVDVDHGVHALADRHTRIARRAIGRDVDAIARIAGDYCDALAGEGVLCTLKHFPGLGRLRHDTHVRQARLDVRRQTLQQTDWVPFRRLMGRHARVVMLGHVIVEDVDPAHAASHSSRVVDGLIRTEWRYDGLLLTDDFCMGAIHESPEGMGEASVQALEAGVDLILVAYDPDQYWFVMNALLRAFRDGRIDDARLMESDRRLRRVAEIRSRW